MTTLVRALAGQGAAPLSRAPFVRGVKVYTRTGDKGTSALYNGTRRPKNDRVFEALGNTDELNSAIGIACWHLDIPKLRKQLVFIQSRLLDLGSAIATPLNDSTSDKLSRTLFSEAHVEQLEKDIDEMEASLPPLKNFILPVSAVLL